MKPFLNITKAIADETRARILLLLQERELCLCQLLDILALAPSTVSKHMTILLQADLVTCRKQGRWHYYRLADKNPSPAVEAILTWVRDTLQDSPVVAEDLERCRKTLATDPKALCERYKC